MMAAITFDTLKYVEALTCAGTPDGQARASTSALANALNQTMDSQLATRADIHKVENDLTLLKADVAVLKWMSALMLAGVVSLVMKQFF
jgi:hypothetical protein